MYLGVGDTEHALSGGVTPTSECCVSAGGGGGGTCVAVGCGIGGLGEFTLPTDSLPLMVSSFTKFAIVTACRQKLRVVENCVCSKLKSEGWYRTELLKTGSSHVVVRCHTHSHEIPSLFSFSNTATISFGLFARTYFLSWRSVTPQMSRLLLRQYVHRCFFSLLQQLLSLDDFHAGFQAPKPVVGSVLKTRDQLSCAGC